ncbi:disease resistance RPP13-like protein 4 [Tripterygium wilfordii]|uniref:Disease resistance RPP13-like protein 4 n=1 Tax=Tripterygium wilfordii TaxID=458696 RepID=A0A7J7C3E4_TRIWF|nr:uncharacterized protein LOC119989592 [Tripterygium wilfordii]KAF5728631.1 disease resistance RPP13-like protein 4 [Tripterygium wilfordii]
MSSASDQLQQTHPNGILNIQTIIDEIPTLIALLTQAKTSISPSTTDSSSVGNGPVPIQAPENNNGGIYSTTTQHDGGNSSIDSNSVANGSVSEIVNVDNKSDNKTDVANGSIPSQTTETNNSSITVAAASPPGSSNENTQNVSNGSIPSQTPETNNHSTAANSAVSESGNNKTKEKTNKVKNAKIGDNNHDVHLQWRNQLDKLELDLRYIRSAFTKLQDLEANVSTQFKTLQSQGLNLYKVINASLTSNRTYATKQVEINFRALSDMIMKLKLQIPSPHKLSAASSVGIRNVETGSWLVARNEIDELLKLHMNEKFKGTAVFKDFQESYMSLEIDLKLCLLCFAVFPENAVVKRRLLMYWWVGEGLVDPGIGEDNAAEKITDGTLKKFLEKGFIEPVLEKYKLVGFRMHPLIRYAVIFLAEKVGFFNFDSRGNPTANFLSELLSCYRACLMKTEEGSSRQVLVNNPDLYPEKLQSLFNVNDPFPDFKFEWFSRLRNVHVLHLGRWQSSDEHHIEVEDTEFLNGLKNMKHLKYLSLQGISRINELPDSIRKLANLRILDLNACHNLDLIPDEISFLKKLTHLDFSECYLLDYMPKGLASLSELKVLKGFVISDVKFRSSCTLEDLSALANLKKLSIHTNKREFPTEDELNALHRMATLKKLTVAWGGKSIQAISGKNSKQGRSSGQTREERNLQTNNSVRGKPAEAASVEPNIRANNPQQDNGAARQVPIQSAAKKLTRTIAFKRGRSMGRELPPQLEKLDLQCFPGTESPSWLMPGKLKSLKKLYIRGGNMRNLSQAQVTDDTWNVKILRLKFLPELRMEWRELNRSFPDMIYLEKVRCPRVTFFPCNESGVWLNRTMISNQPLEKELEFTWSFLGSRTT